MLRNSIHILDYIPSQSTSLKTYLINICENEKKKKSKRPQDEGKVAEKLKKAKCR